MLKRFSLSRKKTMTMEHELDSKQLLGRPKNKTLSKFVSANERESDIGSDWESFSADSNDQPNIE